MKIIDTVLLLIKGVTIQGQIQDFEKGGDTFVARIRGTLKTLTLTQIIN